MMGFNTASASIEGSCLGDLRNALIRICIGLAVVFSGSPGAEEGALREYLIKAAFVYNFTKFVEWPEEVFQKDSSPFIVCILGQDGICEALRTIENKSVYGRKLQIRQSRTKADIDVCHLLFVAESEEPQLSTILKNCDGRPILTVSDMNDFALSGGMIQLYKDENRIRFAVNVKSAERSGLNLSSKLLGLAKIVK